MVDHVFLKIQRHSSTADKFKTNLSVIKSVIKSNENRSNFYLKS